MVKFITLMVLILADTCIIKSGGEHLKHEITALNTKKTLANSLKKFMGIKPLSKITITEIISDCGLNRKTFYYHFEDMPYIPILRQSGLSEMWSDKVTGWLTGPRSEPPMPMLTTVSIFLPETPVHSPERTLSANA